MNTKKFMVVLFTLKIFNIIYYSFLLSHPLKIPPWNTEIITKKISAAKMKRNDGKSMRVNFTPLAAPLLIAIPIRKQ